MVERWLNDKGENETTRVKRDCLERCRRYGGLAVRQSYKATTSLRGRKRLHVLRRLGSISTRSEND
jgi:hypothetical protein